jgi:hypothetical protein
MAHREHPEDFNTFGYDPRGRVSNIAGLMFGENWCPDQQHIPRYKTSNPLRIRGPLYYISCASVESSYTLVVLSLIPEIFRIFLRQQGAIPPS